MDSFCTRSRLRPVYGLHHDASTWNIAAWEKSLRERLWWAAYVTDARSPVGHGNPPHISRASYTTTDLYMDDLKLDEEVPEDLKDMVDAESATVTFLLRHVLLGSFVTLTKTLHTLLETAL